MKKIDYQAPEMEIIEVQNQATLLAGSDPQPPFDPNNDGPGE